MHKRSRNKLKIHIYIQDHWNDVYSVVFSLYNRSHSHIPLKCDFQPLMDLLILLVAYLKFSFLHFLRNYYFGRYGMGPQESAFEQLSPMSDNLRNTILNDIFD